MSSSKEPKLTPQQRAEVNTLIERAQGDLEGVLFELVAQRDQGREHLSDMLGCIRKKDTDSLANLANDVTEFLQGSDKKVSPAVGVLATYHFEKSEVSMQHQTGASYPMSKGMTVTLRFEPGDDEVREVAPHTAMLHYLDEAGDEDETLVGLVFDGRILVDYDGIFELPHEVAGMLVAHGFDVSAIFDPGYTEVAAFAGEVCMASAAFKPAENLAVGDRVTIARIMEEEGDFTMLGAIAEVVGFVTDDCGATPDNPMIRVRLEAREYEGKDDTFWPEELAVFSRAKTAINDDPLPGGAESGKSKSV